MAPEGRGGGNDRGDELHRQVGRLKIGLALLALAWVGTVAWTAVLSPVLMAGHEEEREERLRELFGTVRRGHAIDE